MKPDSEIHITITDDKCEVEINGHTLDLLNGICGALKVLVIQIKTNLIESGVLSESTKESNNATEDLIFSYIISTILENWSHTGYPDTAPTSCVDEPCGPNPDAINQLSNFMKKHNLEDES